MAIDRTDVLDGRRAAANGAGAGRLRADDLIATVYEAALLPDHWALLPERIARTLGAVTGTLLRRDGPLAARPDDGTHATLAIPMAGVETWVLCLEGFHDAAGAVEAQRHLVVLRPHLARAATIADQQALQESRLAVAALDRIGAGAAILDDAGRVLAANARFAGQLGLIGEPVGIPMRLGRRRDVAALRLVLAQAIGGGRRGAVPIHDEAGTCVAALHLLPVAAAAHWGGRTTALVLVAIPRVDAVPPVGLLQALFGLTRAEATIARAIASGDAIEGIAQGSDTSIETVRSHLKHVFSKTGTTRQVALALLVRGFGIAGAPEEERRPAPASTDRHRGGARSLPVR